MIVIKLPKGSGSEFIDYSTKALAELEKLGLPEIYNNTPHLQSASFWSWQAAMFQMGLSKKISPEDLAKRIMDSVNQVKDNPELIKAAKKANEEGYKVEEYTKKLLNKMNSLGFEEFVTSNPYLMSNIPNFKEFMIRQIDLAYRHKIAPERAGEILMAEFRTELSVEKFTESFLSDFNFNDAVKH